MERENIIAKIKKLREHSVENGCSKAEAIQFALKAQKLIAENDVEEWELADEVKKVIETPTKSTSRTWAQGLATVIADNFRCRAYQRQETKHKWSFVFVGWKADSEAAEIVFSSLFEMGHRLGKEYEDFAYTDPNAYNNFVIGFIRGVKSELEKQCKELLLITPMEVNEYYSAKNLVRSRRSTPRASNQDSITRGIQQGRNAVRSRRMQAPGASNFLPA